MGRLDALKRRFTATKETVPPLPQGRIDFSQYSSDELADMWYEEWRKEHPEKLLPEKEELIESFLSISIDDVPASLLKAYPLDKIGYRYLYEKLADDQPPDYERLIAWWEWRKQVYAV